MGFRFQIISEWEKHWKTSGSLGKKKKNQRIAAPGIYLKKKTLKNRQLS